MATYKVIATRTEDYVAFIEADSLAQATQLANTDYSNYDWDDIDGTLDT